MSDQETFINEMDIEALKARDERFRHYDLALKVDAELRESFTLNLILEAASRQMEEAKDAMIDVNPTDSKQIYDLQVKAGCAKLIGQVLNNIRKKGLAAYTSIEEDKFIELDRTEPVSGT